MTVDNPFELIGALVSAAYIALRLIALCSREERSS